MTDSKTPRDLIALGGKAKRPMIARPKDNQLRAAATSKPTTPGRRPLFGR
jgi:hypothetical protein